MSMQAVLTGELSPFDLLDSERKVRARALETVLKQVSPWFKTPAQTFMVGGFQAVLREPEQAFEAWVAIRAGMRAASLPGQRWDVKVGIGLGPEGTPAEGRAFFRSGLGLDSLKTEKVGVFPSAHAVSTLVDLPTAFADAWMDTWTATEALIYGTWLAVRRQEAHPKHAQVADRLGRARVTITRALLQVNASLMDQYLDQMEQVLRAQAGALSSRDIDPLADTIKDLKKRSTAAKRWRARLVPDQ